MATRKLIGKKKKWYYKHPAPKRDDGLFGRKTYPLSELNTCSGCGTRWRKTMIICEKCGSEL